MIHAHHARCFATTRNAYLLNHARAERLLSGEEGQQRTPSPAGWHVVEKRPVCPRLPNSLLPTCPAESTAAPRTRERGADAPAASVGLGLLSQSYHPRTLG